MRQGQTFGVGPKVLAGIVFILLVISVAYMMVTTPSSTAVRETNSTLEQTSDELLDVLPDLSPAMPERDALERFGDGGGPDAGGGVLARTDGGVR